MRIKIHMSPLDMLVFCLLVIVVSLIYNDQGQAAADILLKSLMIFKDIIIK